MSCLGHLFRCNRGPFVKNKSRFVNYTSAEIVLIFAEERPHDITIPLRHETIKREDMTGNFVMLQMDDLRQVVTEIVEEVCAKRGLNEKSSEEEGEWLTREEVCDKLHITYTDNVLTLVLFSVCVSICVAMESGNNKCKEECHG